MYIKIHAFPDSKSESVTEKGKDTLLVYVREPREMNKANNRILEIIRARYPGREVRLISGHHESHKIVSISDKRE
ncbi:MAG: DUF167 family protein [Candidatus Paceibacterota bacterium]|jgi:uncharacterized protein YggU (UPF0235/DUF167 family)